MAPLPLPIPQRYYSRPSARPLPRRQRLPRLARGLVRSGRLPLLLPPWPCPQPRVAVLCGYVHRGYVHCGPPVASSAAAASDSPFIPSQPQPQRHLPQSSARPHPRRHPMQPSCVAMSTQAQPRSFGGHVHGGGPPPPLPSPRSHICRGIVLRRHPVASSTAAGPARPPFPPILPLPRNLVHNDTSPRPLSV